MPTRSMDVDFVRNPLDVQVPSGSVPKQYLRWQQIAAMIGLGPQWVRKRC